MPSRKKIAAQLKDIPKEGKFILRRKDLRDTLIALVILTLIFAYDSQNLGNIVNNFAPALIAIGIALFVNKTVHSWAAKRFGCATYFRLWMPGIVFALLLMIVGFKFPAIGFVVVHPFAFGRWGHRSRRLSMTEEGLMGLAGPGSNILLAMLLRTIPGPMFSYMSFVSAYFAIFNLIPIKPLDGSKIVFWKPLAWLFLVIINILLFFV